MTALIAFTSGKAQSGKSFLSTNLAHYLTSKGHASAVLVAGGSFPVWGAGPCDGWETIASGSNDPVSALKRSLFGVDLALLQGAGSGYQRLSPSVHERVAGSLAAESRYAYLIADVGACPWPPALACCLAATEILLVLTAESDALNIAFNWMTRLKKCGLQRPVNIILNKVLKPALAQIAYARFRDLAQKKLSLKINLWGSISYESLAMQPRVMERPLAESLPQSRVIREIQAIGDRLLAEQPPENQTLTLDSFWVQFLDHLAGIPRPAPDPPPVQKPPRPEPEKHFSKPGEQAPEPELGQIVPELAEEAPEAEPQEVILELTEQAPKADMAVQPPSPADAGRPPIVSEALLIRLCSHVEAITTELAALRRDLEKRSRPPAQPAPAEPLRDRTCEPVVLDFEDYLSQNS